MLEPIPSSDLNKKGLPKLAGSRSVYYKAEDRRMPHNLIDRTH